MGRRDLTRDRGVAPSWGQLAEPQFPAPDLPGEIPGRFSAESWAI
jgi:hypothetical protein